MKIMKLVNKQTLKNSIKLKLWLPLLESNIQELNSYLSDFSQKNPFIKINTNQNRRDLYISNESDFFNLIEEEPSLYEVISKQIEPPLFPTPISQKIAMSIFEDINIEGYFDGDILAIAEKYNMKECEVEKIRQRFRYLEPKGIASKNLEECLLIQLEDLNLEIELENSIKKIILNLESLNFYIAKKSFCEITNIFNKFSYPPALKYMEEEIDVIPDFTLKKDKENLILSYNDSYTQEVVLDKYFRSNNSEIKEKIKEAKDLIDLLQLRKETLHKIVLIIIDVQKEFFDGKNLKPLIMQNIADELSFTESTISRAVANKYLECDRGIFPLKYFFSNQVKKEDLSSNEIKEFLKVTIEKENKQKPYSDEALVPLINKEFSITLSRRAITKYRLALDILSSRDRKKIYQLKYL